MAMEAPDSQCTADDQQQCPHCTMSKADALKLENDVFEKAMKQGIPIIRPIIGAKMPYVFTIGMTRLCPSDDAGEFVIVGLPDRQSSYQILMAMAEQITSGTLKFAELKTGFLVHDVASVPLKIVRHNGNCTDDKNNKKDDTQDKNKTKDETVNYIEQHMGSSQASHFGLPKAKFAYQLLWPDVNQSFDDNKTLMLQTL